jgi:uncharacterized membrane protein YjjP (DUF1212 family)
MSNIGANHAHAESPGERSSSPRAETHVVSAEELALASLAARLLFENGQSTEKVVSTLHQLADALGFGATVVPNWGDLTIRIDDGRGSRDEVIAVAPVGVDMSKVVATIGVIDGVCSGRLDAATARSALEAVSRFRLFRLRVLRCLRRPGRRRSA